MLLVIVLVSAGCTSQSPDDIGEPVTFESAARTKESLPPTFPNATVEFQSVAGEVYTDGCAFGEQGYAVCHFIYVWFNNTGTEPLRNGCAGWSFATHLEMQINCSLVSFDTFREEPRDAIEPGGNATARIVLRGMNEDDRVRLLWYTHAEPMRLPDYSMRFFY